MKAGVTWSEGLSFEGTAESGFKVALGGSAASGGSEDGFRPMELMAISLAGCTGMDVISILRKKRQQISSFEVRVQAEQSGEHPHVFTQIHLEYLVGGTAVEVSAVERAIELSETRYCPVQAMLRQAVNITHSYQIVPESQ